MRVGRGGRRDRPHRPDMSSRPPDAEGPKRSVPLEPSKAHWIWTGAKEGGAWGAGSRAPRSLFGPSRWVCALILVSGNRVIYTHARRVSAGPEGNQPWLRRPAGLPLASPRRTWPGSPFPASAPRAAMKARVRSGSRGRGGEEPLRNRPGQMPADSAQPWLRFVRPPDGGT